MNTFTKPTDMLERDHQGRPGVWLDGKRHWYTRCTTFIDCLSNRYNLERWGERMVALGLADRPDLMLAVAAHRDDKNQLNDIAKQAKEAAKSSSAATTGTALHALCQQVDEGKEIGALPEIYAADLDAYRKATSEFEHLHIEKFMVNDDLQVGGTPDRIVTTANDSRRRIFDIKTGQTLNYSWLEIAMQLAVYSRSVIYNPADKTRQDIDLDTEFGVVAHLPAGQNTCQLYTVDLNAGWDAVQIAKQVREWRRRKNLAWPVEDQLTTDQIAGAFGSAPVDMMTKIATATSVDGLNAIWSEHQTEWTDEHTKLAAARKNILLGKAA